MHHRLSPRQDSGDEWPSSRSRRALGVVRGSAKLGL